jgi:hypothetical protein
MHWDPTPQVQSHGFSSDAPHVPWMLIWLIVPLIFGGTAASLEVFWRAVGYAPSVRDSADLWYFWRERVSTDSPKIVVLLGTSRIRSDISLDAMREQLPGYDVVQLGLSGPQSCVGILRDLAADVHFRGVVVCDLDTPLLERSHWSEHKEQRSYRPESPTSFAAAIGLAWLSGRTAVFRTDLCLRDIARCVFRVREPELFRDTFARETQWNFANVEDIGALQHRITEGFRKQYEQQRLPNWETLQDDAAQIESTAELLRARGGHVIFVRLPSSGRRLALEEQYHPRASNWDCFAKLTRCQCIHFADLPEMESIKCPDGSHLDRRDAPRFTGALTKEMKRRGIFG